MPSSILTFAQPHTRQNRTTFPPLKKATSSTGASSTTGERHYPQPPRAALLAAAPMTAPTLRSAATATAAGTGPTAAATRAIAGVRRNECPHGIETVAYRPARPRVKAITRTDIAETGAGDRAAAVAGAGRMSIRTYPAMIGMRRGETKGTHSPGETTGTCFPGETTGMLSPGETTGTCSLGETTGGGGTRGTIGGMTGIGGAAISTIGHGIAGRGVGAGRRSVTEIARGSETVTGTATGTEIGIGTGIETATRTAGDRVLRQLGSPFWGGQGYFFGNWVG